MKRWISWLGVFLVAQADIAFRTVEKLTDRIISGVKKKCDVTDVLVRTEQILVRTEISEAKSPDASDYFVRQRLRFVCEPKTDLTADIIYTACELNAILYGTTQNYAVRVYPLSDMDIGRPVFFGVKEDAELTRRMYEKALADAAKRAKVHAELAGKKAGKILSIQCDEFINGEVKAEWAIQDGFPTGILGRSSDKICVSYEVVVTYEFAE
ncbi:MAG: SIMPL domain-containing protein [Pontiellaceae bacterium]|nr:SIMPL domain-containing protein [Pontiellaceae bacterium]